MTGYPAYAHAVCWDESIGRGAAWHVPERAVDVRQIEDTRTVAVNATRDCR